MCQNQKIAALSGKTEVLNRGIFSKVGRVLQVLFVTNPLLFWVWANLFPKKMAGIFNSPFYWSGKLSEAIRCADFWEASHLLLRKRKFAFMDAHPKWFSVEDQKMWAKFSTDNGKEWFLEDLSEEAQKTLWANFYGSSKIREKMLDEDYRYSENDIILLVNAGIMSPVEAIGHAKTLSWEVMRALYLSRYPKGKDVFFNLLDIYNISDDFLDIVKKEDLPRLKEGLRKKSQIKLTKMSKKDKNYNLFRSLVLEEGELCREAQAFFNLSLYEIYHQGGKHLDKEMIIFHANPDKEPEWKMWVDRFRKWEDLNFPEWEILRLKNPELRAYLLTNQGVL